jgi:hypothetical protein
MAARKVLMIEPKNFISNPQTVGDNFFQPRHGIDTPEEAQQFSLKEFNALADMLAHNGIEVHVFKQDDALETPDALFPNNWFSTMPAGQFILYPMMAVNRRTERRLPVISFLETLYPKTIDLTHVEKRGIFLEGTGSIVIDHMNRIAYASLSQRTSSNILFEWSKQTGYEVIIFSSLDKNGDPLYHTNVMMTICERFAIICLSAIDDEEAKERVVKSLVRTGHELVEISLEQMHHFCGNCLELENSSGEKFLVTSDNAYQHFSDFQKLRIEKHCRILHTSLDTIETFGGGGARCMLAELF